MLVACLVVVTAANKFFNSIIGRRRNELLNAAGRVFKIAHICGRARSDYQFLYAKVQFDLVLPPHFWPMLLRFVCSGDGTGTGNRKVAGSTFDY